MGTAESGRWILVNGAEEEKVVKRVKVAGLRVYDHLRSPITIRQVALFLALTFLGYAVIRDIQDRARMASYEHRLDVLAEQWEANQSVTNQQAENIDMTRQQVVAQLGVLEQMSSNMRMLSDLLKQERSRRERGDAAMERALKLHERNEQKPTIRKRLPQCFTIVTTQEKIGDNVVIRRDLKRRKCQ